MNVTLRAVTLRDGQLGHPQERQTLDWAAFLKALDTLPRTPQELVVAYVRVNDFVGSRLVKGKLVPFRLTTPHPASFFRKLCRESDFEKTLRVLYKIDRVERDGGFVTQPSETM